jgi:hypothetical protein
MQFSARKGLRFKGLRFKVENISDFNISTKDIIFIVMKVFDAEKNRSGTVKHTNPEIAAALKRGIIRNGFIFMMISLFG